jgi:hypothetical protein
MMTRGIFGKALACLMAVVFPLSMMAAENAGAMVYASNSALVNGSWIQRSSAVFNGDKLQVPANSTVTVTAPGTQMIVPAGSTVTYQGKAVALAQTSGISVITTKGMAVKVDSLTIAPAQGEANFQVARAGGEVLVAARHGAVNIFDGASTRTVAEGKTESLPDPAPQGQGAGAGAGAGAGGATVSTAMAVLIGVAAAAAGAAIGVVASRAPSSPSRP